MIMPGAGHAILGLWRLATLTAVSFLVSAALTALLACGWIGAPHSSHTPLEGDLFFSALWISVAVWFFGIVDAWHSARGGKPTWPNPRVAFLLNFCTRGLGYFYVDHPMPGVLSIVVWALVVEHTTRAGVDWALAPAVLLVQSAMGIHAYALARKRGGLEKGSHQRNTAHCGAAGWAADFVPQLRRIVAPATLVLTAALLALHAVSAAVKTAAENTAVHAFTQRHDQGVVRLKDDGLTVTLPNADWRFEEAQSGNSVGSFVSPRARLVLLRAQRDGRFGLEGFVVDLAGLISERHGLVCLTDQRAFHAGDVQGRELRFEWTEGDIHAWSHVFLVPQDAVMHTVLVAFPPRLDGEVRNQVERLVESFRFE